MWSHEMVRRNSQWVLLASLLLSFLLFKKGDKEEEAGDSVVPLAEILEHVRSKIQDAKLLQKVEQSLEVIDKAFREYRYRSPAPSRVCQFVSGMIIYRFSLSYLRPEETALSFNGGKDCTVLLHLLSFFLRKGTHFQAIYFHNPLCFNEAVQFVTDCAKRYSPFLSAFSKSEHTAHKSRAPGTI